ncbi:MAG TPA: ATP-dependent DNA helicase RecQ, partial [Thermopetrobacter sp.]|nr:ATP-dependent DNA helicase RecQ [Thermopetrobacter sp.]
AQRAALEAMIAYAEATGCRRQLLLAHFGEELAEPCGNCDNCLVPPEMEDMTVAAQKALSCVYRTGQRYGAAHLVDVLRGRETDKVRAAGHDAVSTFGIGTGLSAQRWRAVFRQLVIRGALDVSEARHGALVLTEKARPLLRGEERFTMRRAPAGRQTTRRRRREKGEADAFAAALTAEQAALLAELKRWRLQEARARARPDYVIMHDATLADIAVLQPATPQALATVDGIGEAKLARYGRDLLDIVRRHREQGAA